MGLQGHTDEEDALSELCSGLDAEKRIEKKRRRWKKIKGKGEKKYKKKKLKKQK